jgi:hypothetical protein
VLTGGGATSLGSSFVTRRYWTGEVDNEGCHSAINLTDADFNAFRTASSSTDGAKNQRNNCTIASAGSALECIGEGEPSQDATTLGLEVQASLIEMFVDDVARGLEENHLLCL